MRNRFGRRRGRSRRLSRGTRGKSNAFCRKARINGINPAYTNSVFVLLGSCCSMLKTYIYELEHAFRARERRPPAASCFCHLAERTLEARSFSMLSRVTKNKGVDAICSIPPLSRILYYFPLRVSSVYIIFGQLSRIKCRALTHRREEGCEKSLDNPAYL